MKHLPHTSNKPRLAVLAPAPEELKLKPDDSDRAITFVDSPQTADYVLVGRYNGSKSLEYAWAAPGASADAGPLAPARPVRTEWLSLDGQRASFDSASRALANSAQQLALIVGWLDLRSPADDPFAYHLTIRDSQTGAEIGGGELGGGRGYKLALRRELSSRNGPVEPRRVYVFVIDSFGKGTLLFPSGNLENEFPAPHEASAPVIDLTKAPEDFSVTEPYGIDNYFLLTTREPIDDPQTVFNFEGVRTRGLGTSADPLSRLLSMRATGTRGSLSGVPTDWSIEHIALRSVPPNAGR